MVREVGREEDDESIHRRSDMTDAEFLRIFVEKIQPVTGWASRPWEGKVDSYPVIRLEVRKKKRAGWYRRFYVPNGNWTSGGGYYDHEAACLVREHLRAWLWGVSTKQMQITRYRDGSWSYDFLWPQFERCKGPDENAALVAAFDASQKALARKGSQSDSI